MPLPIYLCFYKLIYLFRTVLFHSPVLRPLHRVSLPGIMGLVHSSSDQTIFRVCGHAHSLFDKKAPVLCLTSRYRLYCGQWKSPSLRVSVA